MNDFLIQDRSSVNEKVWNDYLVSGDVPFYNTLEFLDALSPGWKVLTNAEQSFYFPLPIKKILGFPYLVQPAFCQQLWFLSKQNLDSKFVSLALSFLVKNYRHINLQIGGIQDMIAPGFNVEVRSNFVLKGLGVSEALIDRYSTNLKRNISKSKRLNLQMQQLELEEAISLFKERTLKQKSVSVIKDVHLKSLVDFLSKDREMRPECLGLEMDGKVLSSACFIIDKNRAYYLLSANSEESRRTGASAYLIDQFLRSDISKNVEVLDFEGSNILGLQRFYKSFGAEPEKYYHVRRSPLKKKV